MMDLLPKCSDSKGKCQGVMTFNKKGKDNVTCTLCGYLTGNHFICSKYSHSIVCENCNRKSFKKTILTSKVSKYFETQNYMIQPSKAGKRKKQTAVVVQQE